MNRCHFRIHPFARMGQKSHLLYEKHSQTERLEIPAWFRCTKAGSVFRLSLNAHVRYSSCQPNRSANTSNSMWSRSEPNLSASIQTKTNQPHLSVEEAVGHGLKGLHLEVEAARVGFFSNTRALEKHSHLAAIKMRPRRS